MEILIKTTRISSRHTKDQRVHSIRTDEKKGKNSSPIMGLFRASGKVEKLDTSTMHP